MTKRCCSGWAAAGILCLGAWCGRAAAGGADAISLAGEWTFALDPDDAGEAAAWFDKALSEVIELPGSTAERGFGFDVSTNTVWTGQIVDRSWFTEERYAAYREPGNVKVPFWLTPVKTYVGPVWYAREVTIPEAWRGKRVTLFLERPHWETKVWVDGRLMGMQESLCTPHRHVLGALVPGRHRLAVRVDNRVKIDVGVNAHSVSDHTQTNWNGLIGALELRATDPVWIDDLQVYPDIEGKRIRVRLALGRDEGAPPAAGTLRLRVRDPGEAPGKSLPELVVPVRPGADDVMELEYPMGESPRLWDEFAPNLYRLEATLETGGSDNGQETGAIVEASAVFGMRAFAADGTRFTINGRPAFLRGTLECCIFPLTGYPPMSVEPWRRILRVARAHGLNHVRFHSWCPPRAAFVAADELGFMFHVECAAWTHVGDDPLIDGFIRAEGDRILAEYGNHPSFCMLAYGNEPGGANQRQFLGDLVNSWKAKDRRRLYTSAAGWPSIPENDYHSTPEPRIQAWGGGLASRINARAPETVTDYSGHVQASAVPLVTHEIGQWCVFPNLREIGKYTGVTRAYNFEIVRDGLRASHMLDQADAFLVTSGELQALCYKEEIESALRTPGLGGFQLLDLHDFPGQGTALVGVLDPFWDEKGYISAAEYHEFACETVPLARLAKRVWAAGETFEAELEIAHFGPAPLEGARLLWSIRDDAGRVLERGELGPLAIPQGNGTRLGRVAVSLPELAAAAKRVLRVDLAGTAYGNQWDFWVYPAQVDVAVPRGIMLVDDLTPAARAALAEGGTVLLMPGRGRVKGDAHGAVPPGFSPIFWNTAWTRRQPPHTLGILCDPAHPALAAFPTESHSNWQWWELVTRSQPMILDGMPPELRPIVQVIDDWVTNRRLGLAFEARVGRGKLLVASIDLREDLATRPVARQLLHSLLRYMQSARFEPRVLLSPDAVGDLLRVPPNMMLLGARVVRADSEQPGYEAANAIDGESGTIWHTRWDGTPPGYPHEIVLDLGRAVELAGVRVLPRQDMDHGWIREYAIFLSDDGAAWGAAAAEGAFAADGAEKQVRFASPRSARYVRLVARSGLEGQPWASLAELDVMLARPPALQP